MTSPIMSTFVFAMESLVALSTCLEMYSSQSDMSRLITYLLWTSEGEGRSQQGKWYTSYARRINSSSEITRSTEGLKVLTSIDILWLPKPQQLLNSTISLHLLASSNIPIESPSSMGAWSVYRYSRKLTNVSNGISGMDIWGGGIKTCRFYCNSKIEYGC